MKRNFHKVSIQSFNNRYRPKATRPGRQAGFTECCAGELGRADVLHAYGMPPQWLSDVAMGLPGLPVCGDSRPVIECLEPRLIVATTQD